MRDRTNPVTITITLSENDAMSLSHSGGRVFTAEQPERFEAIGGGEPDPRIFDPSMKSMRYVEGPAERILLRAWLQATGWQAIEAWDMGMQEHVIISDRPLDA